MTVLDLYKVLDNDVFIRIINESGVCIMLGIPSEITVGALECRVKSIKKSNVEDSIADIDIVVEG